MTEFEVQEFVVFDDTGKEVDWVDPVVSVEETPTTWRVDNGFGVWDVAKFPGARYEIRVRREIEFL